LRGNITEQTKTATDKKIKKHETDMEILHDMKKTLKEAGGR
jgi:hypothetical protein